MRSPRAAHSIRAAARLSIAAGRSAPSPARSAPTLPPAGSMSSAMLPRGEQGPPPLLTLDDVGRAFDVSRPWLNRVIEGAPRQLLHAVDGVSFEVRKGETFALVGESGCGKSTIARLIVGLYAPSRGRIEFDGVQISDPQARVATAKLRRRMQMIFQDPYASLNPRWRVRDIVADRIGVMYLGRLVEIADAEELFSRPRHPYTRMLLDAVPDLEMSGRQRTPVAGEVPNPLAPPSGCAFHPRCPHANDRCKSERPNLIWRGETASACHAVEEDRI